MAADILYCLVIFTTVAAECLVAVWAATSPRPRLLRAFVVWLAIVPLIPIRAYGPALLFAVNAIATAGIAAAVRLRERGRFAAAGAVGRFSVADLLVVTLVVGTLIALSGYYSADVRQRLAAIGLFGLPLAPLIAAAHYTGVGPARVQAGLALFAALLFSTGLLVYWDVAQTLQISPRIGLGHPRVGNRELLPHLVTLGCFALSMPLIVW